MNEQFDALKRIRQLCAERHYSYYELAKRSGIPYSTLNTMLLKQTQPSLPTLQRICDGLGLSMQQFFGEEDAQTLTAEQKECLSLFQLLNAEEKAMALAYMKGLARRL